MTNLIIADDDIKELIVWGLAAQSDSQAIAIDRELFNRLERAAK